MRILKRGSDELPTWGSLIGLAVFSSVGLAGCLYQLFRRRE